MFVKELGKFLIFRPWKHLFFSGFLFFELLPVIHILLKQDKVSYNEVNRFRSNLIDTNKIAYGIFVLQ